jgi:hypothetical protein
MRPYKKTLRVKSIGITKVQFKTKGPAADGATCARQTAVKTLFPELAVMEEGFTAQAVNIGVRTVSCYYIKYIREQGIYANGHS